MVIQSFLKMGVILVIFAHLFSGIWDTFQIYKRILDTRDPLPGPHRLGVKKCFVFLSELTFRLPCKADLDQSALRLSSHQPNHVAKHKLNDK